MEWNGHERTTSEFVLSIADQRCGTSSRRRATIGAPRRMLRSRLSTSNLSMLKEYIDGKPVSLLRPSC